jgi:hypothetical protein
MCVSVCSCGCAVVAATRAPLHSGKHNRGSERWGTGQKRGKTHTRACRSRSRHPGGVHTTHTHTQKCTQFKRTGVSRTAQAPMTSTAPPLLPWPGEPPFAAGPARMRTVRGDATAPTPGRPSGRDGEPTTAAPLPVLRSQARSSGSTSSSLGPGAHGRHTRARQTGGGHSGAWCVGGRRQHASGRQREGGGWRTAAPQHPRQTWEQTRCQNTGRSHCDCSNGSHGPKHAPPYSSSSAPSVASPSRGCGCGDSSDSRRAFCFMCSLPAHTQRTQERRTHRQHSTGCQGREMQSKGSSTACGA